MKSRCDDVSNRFVFCSEQVSSSGFGRFHLFEYQ
jgi:hypothetical protein